MIQNERQFKITQNQIETLNAALAEFESSSADAPDWIVKAQSEALNSQITELRSEVIEYELLKSGKNRYLECSNLVDLPISLIRARIASGLSQKELAESLGLSMQQIQRYESSDYSGASLSRLIEIANALGITISTTWTPKELSSGNSIYVWNDQSDIKWEDFPTKEMIRRNWFEIDESSIVTNVVRNYFESTAGPEFLTAYHRKKFHGTNSPKEYSLLAWQARILEKANKIIESNGVSAFSLDDSWIEELVALSVYEDGPARAKELLAEKGIALVFERHLEQTYLDGAAMLHGSGNPVIGLTLRHDRLDNFWFVLFHELGHVYLHLFDSLGMDFFDEQDDGYDSDQIEQEADLYSLNKLIPPELWDTCLSRFTITEEAVLMDAERLAIHPSIIAGRIRSEQDKYYLLSDLLGSGMVRTQFEEYQ